MKSSPSEKPNNTLKLSSDELSVIDHLINLDDVGGVRTFPLNTLRMALDINTEVMKSSKNNEKGVPTIYAGSVEFSTEQKAFIIEFMKTRKFSTAQWKHALSLNEKLN